MCTQCSSTEDRKKNISLSFDTLSDLLQVFCEKYHQRGMSKHLHGVQREGNMQIWAKENYIFDVDVELLKRVPVLEKTNMWSV